VTSALCKTPITHYDEHVEGVTAVACPNINFCLAERLRSPFGPGKLRPKLAKRLEHAEAHFRFSYYLGSTTTSKERFHESCPGFVRFRSRSSYGCSLSAFYGAHAHRNRQAPSNHLLRRLSFLACLLSNQAATNIMTTSQLIRCRRFYIHTGGEGRRP